MLYCHSVLFSLSDPPATVIYTLSLHDALPISTFAIDYALTVPIAPTYPKPQTDVKAAVQYLRGRAGALGIDPDRIVVQGLDRKSTRLNSSHRTISYAVFCLKKKKKKKQK